MGFSECLPLVASTNCLTFDTDQLVIEALRAGANGFLLKDTPPADIITAIHKTIAGEPVLSPAATVRLIHNVTAEPGPETIPARRLGAVAALTDREREVAFSIAEGRSNQQIAETSTSASLP